MSLIDKGRKIMIIGLVLSLVMMFAGCANVAKKAVEKSTGVSVDKDSGKVKIKTKEGEAEIQSGTKKLPEGFPEKFPIYKGAKLVTSSKISGQEGKVMFSASWQTEDDPSTVSKFYKDELPKNGYEVTNTVEQDNHTMFTLKDGIVQVLTDNKGKTLINVSFNEQ